jgi:hypothetical protein
VALPLGFVDIKVCAVTDIWSALKLVVRMSPIGIMEPGMFGVMEPPFGGGNRHPSGFKNGRILSCWQASI